MRRLGLTWGLWSAVVLCTIGWAATVGAQPREVTPSETRQVVWQDNAAIIGAGAADPPASQAFQDGTLFWRTDLRWFRYYAAGAWNNVPVFTGGVFTAPLLGPPADNCATTPPYSFTADGTTGLCSTAAGTIVLRTAGTNRVTLLSTGATFTVPILLPDGTATAPALRFASGTYAGVYATAADTMRFVSTRYSYFTDVSQAYAVINGSTGWALGANSSSINPTYQFFGNATQIRMLSGHAFGWSSGSTDALSNALDTILVRDGAANTLAQKNGNADQFARIYGANGGYWERGVNSELLTIAAAASTDTTGNLLPANAVIEAVVVRVTTVIPTAATFTVGEATTAARFATGVAVAQDTTAVGLLHRNPADADAAGPVQTAAAKVRITPNAQPGAATGVVRIEVFFSRFVPPTS